jgi:thioredoxin-like negative regulator of GroEL
VCPVTAAASGCSVATDAEHYLQKRQDMTTKALTDATFNTEVLMSDMPVLVHFWATWSGPCAWLSRSSRKMANEHPDTLSVVELDVDANPVSLSG